MDGKEKWGHIKTLAWGLLLLRWGKKQWLDKLLHRRLVHKRTGLRENNAVMLLALNGCTLVLLLLLLHRGILLLLSLGAAKCGILGDRASVPCSIRHER